MAFRLRSDAEKWFSNVFGKDPIKQVFDVYYFCLMIGLTRGRSRDPIAHSLPTKDMVDYFIEDYKPAQGLLTGLLVVAELRKRGINMDEKSSVRGVFKDLVSTQTPSGLTADGMRLMNAYASGGYEFLAENRSAKPNSPEEFLRDYVGLMDEAARQAA